MPNVSTPIFATADVRAAVAFYRNVLGFSDDWFWNGSDESAAPTFGGVRLGRAEIFFVLDPALAAKVAGHQHWFRTEEIDSLYARHREAGAPIIAPLEEKPWGVREYVVRDPAGYHLRFAGPPVPERPATATDALPSHIEIRERLPTLAEYMAITDAVGWATNAESMKEALGHTRLGVVAVDTRDGRTVGMARVIGDGRNFTIWDVAVLPSHQRQKIGTAIMEEALAALRRTVRSGTFVGLYTAAPAFYERLGFVQAGGMKWEW